MAKVTGIGGVLLRAQDPKALNAWYAQHLGIELSEYGGANFLWAEEGQPDQVTGTHGMTAWSTFPADTKYFGPGKDGVPQAVMINYRVDDLDALLAQLTEAGVSIDPKRENASYGKFAWITDPEGNRLELWQPLVEASEPEK